MTENTRDHVLTFDSPQKPGIVHGLTGVLLEHGGDIVELKTFDDPRTVHFFARVHFRFGDGVDGIAAAVAVRKDMEGLAAEHGARWDVQPADQRRRVLIMVSKFDHCLNDLLYRAHIGELPVEIAAVVSNHQDHRRSVEWYGIPYFHIPVTPETKPEAEQRLLDLTDRFEIDLVVLARYMQVLSDSLATKMEGRIINIHHSFLPSFKGARPYHQAFERGVKTVGATAHYVNSELDEGPIIAQQVVQVDHTHGPEELVAAGRDTERKALSDAVRWHCEGRVMLHQGRTVVLR